MTHLRSARPTGVAIGALTVVLVVAACGASGPVVTSRLPTAGQAASSVRPSGSAGGAGGGLVTVDFDPTGVVAEWIPGINSGSCREELTMLGPLAAQRLASAVRTAPRFPSGPISCPSDDGTRVALYFTYRATTDVDLVDIGLTGCGSIGAPGRHVRRLDAAVTGALRPAAPPDWARYVS